MKQRSHSRQNTALLSMRSVITVAVFLLASMGIISGLSSLMSPTTSSVSASSIAPSPAPLNLNSWLDSRNR